MKSSLDQILSFFLQISVAVDDQTQLLLALLIPIMLIVIVGGGCFAFFWIRARKEPPPLIPNENYHLVVSTTKTNPVFRSIFKENSFTTVGIQTLGIQITEPSE